MNDISLRIKVLVEKFTGGNISRFAALTGTSEVNIRNYTQGTQPKFEFLKNVVEKLKVNSDWLLMGIGEILLVESKLIDDEKKIVNVKNEMPIEFLKMKLELLEEYIAKLHKLS